MLSKDAGHTCPQQKNLGDLGALAVKKKTYTRRPERPLRNRQGAERAKGLDLVWGWGGAAGIVTGPREICVITGILATCLHFLLAGGRVLSSPCWAALWRFRRVFFFNSRPNVLYSAAPTTF